MNFPGLIEEIGRRFPAYASIKYPRPFRLTEISINPDDYVIVFSTFDEGIARQLIHDNKIIKSDFISQPLKDLEADVVTFRKNLGDANLQNFNPDLASSLFASLFQGSCRKYSGRGFTENNFRRHPQPDAFRCSCDHKKNELVSN